MTDRLAFLQSEAHLPDNRCINQWACFSNDQLENSYRESQLPHDRWLASMCMAIAAAASLVFIYTDYRMLGDTETFWGLLMLRSTMIVASLSSMVLIRHLSPKGYDILTCTFVVMMAAAMFIIDSTRTVEFLTHVRFDVILLISIFVVFVTRFQIQLLMGLGYAAAIGVSVLIDPNLPALTAMAEMAGTLFVILAGAMLAWRLHRLGRRQYRSTLLEKQLGMELQRLAFTDSLTGISNRRDFMVHAEAELERHKRHQRPFSLLILDLDFFKKVNDQYGHEVGDQVLIDFSRILGTTVRTLDTLARLGGEEFAILLPETRVYGARKLATRIQSLTREMRFGPDGEGNCTVSIGVTQAWPEDQSVEQILRRTDQAMYAAKAEGRNRIVTLSGLNDSSPQMCSVS